MSITCDKTEYVIAIDTVSRPSPSVKYQSAGKGDAWVSVG